MSHASAEERIARVEYIHAMLGQLRVMAEGEKHDMLAYLIDMARVEAGEILRIERRGSPRRDRSMPS